MLTIVLRTLERLNQLSRRLPYGILSLDLPLVAALCAIINGYIGTSNRITDDTLTLEHARYRFGIRRIFLGTALRPLSHAYHVWKDSNRIETLAWPKTAAVVVHRSLFNSVRLWPLVRTVRSSMKVVVETAQCQVPSPPHINGKNEDIGNAG